MTRRRLRWRCLVDDCPQHGQWHTAPNPATAAHAHYMAKHYQPPGGTT